MDPVRLAPLRGELLWLAVRRSTVNGRACREYEILDGAGGVLLAARAFFWGREIVVTAPDGRAEFSIVRSRAFPITGKAIVRERPSGSAIGTVHRNGTYRDRAGAVRGRFRDARSAGERTKESVFQGVMETMLSTGPDSMPSGPDALVLHVDGAVAGTLTYAVLPFASQEEADRRSARPMLPRFVRKAWQSLNAPRGWKFVRHRTSDDDPRLQVAAALFAAELSRWG